MNSEDIVQRYEGSAPLKDDLFYKIRGRVLNELYDFAVKNYNEEKPYEDRLPMTVRQSYYMGYAKAIDGIRGMAQLPMNEQEFSL